MADRRANGAPQGDAVVEVSTLPEARTIGADGRPRLALFVTGPGGATRHMLPPSGIVRLGRSLDATITIEDPRVSRAHAVIHLNDAITVCDLGSTNGTFVANRRLDVGEDMRVACGETFLVGDSALVVRPAPIGGARPETLVPLDGLRAHLVSARSQLGAAAKESNGALVVIKARAVRPEEAAWVEGILSDLLTAPWDWLTRAGAEGTAIGIATSPSQAFVAERAVRARLRLWDIEAAIESLFVPDQVSEAQGELVLSFIRGEAPRLEGAPVVRDPGMVMLHDTVRRVAPTDVNVLVLGETGVGKDVLASLVHSLSPRADKPFVRLNCASVPESLLESELFGHERGAFTGASTSKKGLLEAADGGTVFLDEIGDLPERLQAKLLRAVESREITRVGGLRPHPLDVRFVAATNRDLAEDVASGRFRRDLYYRLNCVTLTLPPLRQRPSEIVPLAHHFMTRACRRFQRPEMELSKEAIAMLIAHTWPGNVREVCNVMERAVVMADARILRPTHLLFAERTVTSAGAGVVGTSQTISRRAPSAPKPSDEIIVGVLDNCAGNQTRAAQVLGMPRRTLVRKIAQMGLRRPRKPKLKP